MYGVSAHYRAYTDNSAVRLAHSKIIVDGVTYDGQRYIKKYPAISWQAEFIGSFPAKSCTFEMYNAGVDLVGKDVYVYRGLDIDGVIEWVPMGVFVAKADGVTSNSTGDAITFTGYDKATVFDVEYTGVDITYPCTIAQFVQEMAFAHGLDFDSTPFPCCDILLETAPNIPQGTTEREIIRQIAELGGANAWINRTGALCISQPRETDVKISKRKYTSLSSKENVFGPINTVVLGKVDYDDDIIYQNEDAASGVIEWRLENNIFAEVDRAAFAEYIGDTYILKMQYVPFEISGCVDDWYLDIGDVIQIQDKSGEYFTTCILSYETSDRIKAKISAAVPNDMLTNYEIAGTTKKQLQYVNLKVDHVNNVIESLAVAVDEDMTAMQSQISQNAESIISKVSYGDIISSINQTAETVQIDASKINLNGYVTISDLRSEGETVIAGGNIDTSTLNVGGWRINDNGLYYGYEGSPDLYLGTTPIVASINGTWRGNLVFKAGDTFAVCADGCLYATQGEFGGDLTGDTVTFNNLVANAGGSITIGGWQFLSDGLEYNGGYFDFEYSGGVAKVSSIVPMQVGPWANGIVNALTLYGTHIYLTSSDSGYNMQVWVPGTSEASLTPTVAGTCNIGTSSYYFDYTYANHHITVSARRYKTDIEDATNFYSSIDDLRPVTFKMKDARTDEIQLGFIAEEVNEVCPYVVTRDDVGDVSGIDYSKITVLLVDEIQKLRKRVKALEGA